MPGHGTTFGPWAAMEAAARQSRDAAYSPDDDVIFEPASARDRWAAGVIDLVFAVVLTLGTQWVLFVLLYGSVEGTAAAGPYVYAQNIFALSMLVVYPWLATARGGGWGKRAFDIMSVDESTGRRPGYGSGLISTLYSARWLLLIASIISPLGRDTLAALASRRLSVVRRSCSIDQYKHGAWRSDPRSPIPLESERRAVVAPRSIRDTVLTGTGAGTWVGRVMLAIVAIFVSGWLIYNAIWLVTR